MKYATLLIHVRKSVRIGSRGAGKHALIRAWRREMPLPGKNHLVLFGWRQPALCRHVRGNCTASGARHIISGRALNDSPHQLSAFERVPRPERCDRRANGGLGKAWYRSLDTSWFPGRHTHISNDSGWRHCDVFATDRTDCTSLKEGFMVARERRLVDWLNRLLLFGVFGSCHPRTYGRIDRMDGCIMPFRTSKEHPMRGWLRGTVAYHVGDIRTRQCFARIADCVAPVCRHCVSPYRLGIS
jgi:hypothetical protein